MKPREIAAREEEGIMAKLVHIQASPRGNRSASQAVASCFIESYLATHAGDTVDALELWRTDLPEIKGTMLDAAYAVKHGRPHSPEQFHVWQAIVRIADHFKSADKYLLSLPMWNFSIPYKLKHYIDLLVHRGLTFSFTPEEGYRGLVARRGVRSGFRRGRLGSAGQVSGSYLRIHRLYRDPKDSRRADGSDAHLQAGNCGRRASPSNRDGKEFLNRPPGAECQNE